MLWNFTIKNYAVNIIDMILLYWYWYISSIQGVHREGVVLDSVIMVFIDKDSILYQICTNFFNEDIFYIRSNMHIYIK